MSLAVVVPFAVFAAGFLAAFGVVSRRLPSPTTAIALALACAPGLGFGSLSLVWFYARLLHLPAPSPAVAALALTVLAFAAFFAARSTMPSRRPTVRSTGNWKDGLQVAWLGLTLLVLIVGWWRWTASRPYGVWDAVAIWTGRALMLSRADDPGEVLSRVVQAHPDYPLLVPAGVAAQYRLAASEALLIPQLTSLAFLLGLGVMVWIAVSAWRPGWPATAAVLLLFSTPAVLVRGFTQCADVPLAYCFVAVVAGLASRLDSTLAARASPALCGFFLGLLVWVKNEGLVLAGIAVVAFVALCALTGKMHELRRDALPILLGAAPGVLAFALFRRRWSPPVEEIDKYFIGGFRDRLTDPERWQIVAEAFWDHLSPVGQTANWGWLWSGLLAVAILTWRRERLVTNIPTLYLGAVCAASAAAWFMIYVLTPYGLKWHLGSSLDRLLLQLVPCFVVLTFVAASLADRRTKST